MTDDEAVATTTLSWSHPKRNLWVATSEGEHAGFVEMVVEHFNSFDGLNGRCGSYANLREAQSAVRDALETQRSQLAR